MAVKVRNNDVKASNLYFLGCHLGFARSVIDNKTVLEAGGQTLALSVFSLILMAVLMIGIGLLGNATGWLRQYFSCYSPILFSAT
jgi:hypothetical protein